MDVNINLLYHRDASLFWKRKKKMKDNKIYNTTLYCRLSLNDEREGDSSSSHTQKILLEKYRKDKCISNI